MYYKTPTYGFGAVERVMRELAGGLKGFYMWGEGLFCGWGGGVNGTDAVNSPALSLKQSSPPPSSYGHNFFLLSFRFFFLINVLFL